MTTPPIPAGFRIRPGLPSDISAAAALYVACFGSGRDPLVGALFPTMHAHPEDFLVYLRRHFARRWWTPGWTLCMLVDERAESDPSTSVGFAWWKRPAACLTFAERWLSPYAWLAPLMRLWISLQAIISPTLVRPETASILDRALAAVVVEPGSLAASPRRADACYLSSVAVLPSLQGRSLGDALIRRGLRSYVDRFGLPCWLVSLGGGVDAFYRRHGFVEVARANVGELVDWDGGAVMYRE